MTFHTRAATDEIYDLFNQPLQTPGGEDSDESDESDYESEDDYTMSTQIDPNADTSMRDADDMDEDEEDATAHSTWSEPDENIMAQVKCAANGMGKLQIHKDETETVLPPRKFEIPPPPENYDPPTLPYHLAKDQTYMQSRLPFMTPIAERTESLPPTTIRSRNPLGVKTPSRPPGGSTFDVLEESDEEDATFQIRQPLQPAILRAAAQLPRAPVKQEPIIQDILCNPLDEGLRKNIYEKLNPPLSSYPGFYQHSTKSGRGAEIRKFCKAIGKKDAEKATLNLPNAPTLEFITGDGGSSFTIKRELGKGAFAPVFLVENNLVADAEDDEDECMDERLKHRRTLEALKMEHPPSPWEFYIMRQLMLRLDNTRPLDSIVRAHEMQLFADEAFLFIDYRDQGTVLDLVNTARSEPNASAGTAMDELLAMFLAVELLRTVEAFHQVGIIHGDLKPDNCLVRFEPTTDAEWSPKYKPDGSAGWSKKGVSFIDFGRGIDMTLFTPSVQFVADWKTDNQDCAEMREMRPWTYQVDYHGLASIIYTMLFGKYIETVAERSQIVGGSTKHYRIATSLKRYWQQEIWNEVFEVLLNPLQHTGGEEMKGMPINNALSRCRRRMEEWLAGNCEKGVGLKALIRKMEGSLGRRR